MAADHGGFLLKEGLKKALSSVVPPAWTIEDLGSYNADPCDYPLFAEKLARRLPRESGKAYGVLICSSGIGMSIAANRYRHVRAALCFNEETSIMARRHNDANVIVFGAGFVDVTAAFGCLLRFLETAFDGDERHQRRLALVESLSKE
jgi:ribose 5-phosphate isomerase B